METRINPVVAMILALVVGLSVSCRKSGEDDDSRSDEAVAKKQVAVPEQTFVTVSDTADSRHDFEIAISSGDKRFVGIMGFAVEVPGVPDFYKQYGKTYGVKIVEGTSDSYPDQESLERDVFLREYAEGYNRLLISHLRSEDK